MIYSIPFLTAVDSFEDELITLNCAVRDPHPEKVSNSFQCTTDFPKLVIYC